MNLLTNSTSSILDNFSTSVPNVQSPSEDFEDYPHSPQLLTVLPMTLIYIILLLSGTVGNIVTCIVIFKIKSMHTATNYYLFSLAISDLLLLLLGLPQEIYQLWFPTPYIFGGFFCVFRGLAAETSTNASVLLITAFTMERYFAICHPIRAHVWSKLSRAFKLIGVIWLVSIVCALPVALQFGVLHPGTPHAECNVKYYIDHVFEVSTLAFFCLPMSAISILYIFIGLKLKLPKEDKVQRQNQQAQLSTTSPGCGMMSGSQKRLNNSRRAVLKMLVAVVVAFFICWAPFHAQRLLAIYASQPPSDTVIAIYTVLTHLSGVLYYVSATINPILYHTMSLKFRKAFKDILASCFLKRKKKSCNLNSFSMHRLSTIRSRLADVTDSSIINVDGDERLRHGENNGGSINNEMNNSLRQDSISNSSLHVTDDDAYTPQELSSMMAELNCREANRRV